MKKLIVSTMALLCLAMLLPAAAMGKKPQQASVTILYVDKDNSNTTIATAEFIPDGPGHYTLDNSSPVITDNLPTGYGLVEGNHYVINVDQNGRISPDTVRFKVQHVAVTPAPTATPAPTVEPTATPAPTAEPTATPAPTAEPSATPAPTAEPTATPAPTAEPTATPAPTEEPTATPAPTAKPTATPAPTATPESSGEYDPPKSGDVSVIFTALSAIAAAGMLLRRR